MQTPGLLGLKVFDVLSFLSLSKYLSELLSFEKQLEGANTALVGMGRNSAATFHLALCSARVSMDTRGLESKAIFDEGCNIVALAPQQMFDCGFLQKVLY